MKFRVTMKDPDTLDEAIRDAISANPLPDLDPDEADGVREKRVEKIGELCCSRWFKYGEYLTVEVDTEAKTCVVIPNGG